MKPAPCSFIPGLLIRSLARKGSAASGSAPTDRSALITPTVATRSTSGMPSAVDCSAATRCSTALASCRSSRSATVIAMRTAADPAPSDHGWSGMAKTSRIRRLPAIEAASTRRQKVWRMLLDVMKPKRCSRCL